MSEDAKIQQQSTVIKGEFKLKFEELVHKNIMEELQFMAKNKINCSSRKR